MFMSKGESREFSGADKAGIKADIRAGLGAGLRVGMQVDIRADRLLALAPRTQA